MPQPIRHSILSSVIKLVVNHVAYVVVGILFRGDVEFEFKVKREV